MSENNECVETPFSNIVFATMCESASRMLPAFFGLEVNDHDIKSLVKMMVLSATLAEREAEEQIPDLSSYVYSVLSDDSTEDGVFEALEQWTNLAHKVGLTPYVIHHHPEEGS